MQQVPHIALFFAITSSNMLVMKIFCHDHVCCTVMKKMSSEEGRILAFYLYINFLKLNWYNSEIFRILNVLKILFLLDLLLPKVMRFKIRFLALVLARIAVLRTRPYSIIQACKCE